jgi:hypothetical protein
MATKVTIDYKDWQPEQLRYMQPRVNDRGGKAISIISTQLNRSLHVTTPRLATWGISDFVNEQGESDGKFSMSLRFPNPDYETEDTNIFLEKLKKFEERVIDDAVTNSELWWGEEMPREVIKHNFFPFLTYQKDKMTKKIDYTKPPKMKIKVPNYGGKWPVEVYDPMSNLLFSQDNEDATPVDFVPRNSEVACLIQCSGIWIGGKGWGITWKLTQCIVKPPVNVSVFGKCHITLSEVEKEKIMESAPDVENEEDGAPPSASQPLTRQEAVAVEDSEDEESEPEPEPAPAPAPKKKKVVRKKASA